MNLSEKLSKFINGWVQATKEPFTEHPIANLFRQDFKQEIESIVKMYEPSFHVKASVGAGNWANVPWLSILNPKITSTTQDGIYPVYLFRSDGSGFYLSLIQGTTTPTKNLGKRAAEKRAQKVKAIILKKLPKLSSWGGPNIDLKAETSLGKSYEKTNIAAKYYDASAMPSSERLIEDLRSLLDIYKGIEKIDIEKMLNIDEIPEPTEALESSFKNLTSLSKPFLLLAGISGTGKTRFVREQAKATGSLNETYCLTAVRPDWHEPSDLLGYISRLGKQPQYIATDVLRFIVQAWREIIDSIEYDEEGLPYDWRGYELEHIRPFWLCLDEMNLAPVEQYFSDYLSILETRCWNDPEKLADSGRNYIYECDPLIKGTVFTSLDVDIPEHEMKPTERLAKDLGFDLSKPLDQDIWGYFLCHGISIPFNLIVAGTVNMDETTHGFSRKVIDRALSFDFGAFFPNDYTEFFVSKSRDKTLSYPMWSHACQADLDATCDQDGAKSLAFLSAVNSVLKNTPFELAYRALNELLLAVVSVQPQDEHTLQAVWDDFLMCKVLPRIEGDVDKLGSAPSLLERLETVLLEQLSPIWHEEKGSPNARPDLYRETMLADDDVAEDEKIIRIACRSQGKLKWMNDRLTSAGFTSFWP